MTTRADKMARIAAIQQQLHRLAEWDLMELRRREQDLEAQQHHLIEVLNDREGPLGRFVEATSRRLGAASSASSIVVKEKAKQADIVVAASRRLKQVQRMASAAAQLEFQQQDKRTLEDLVNPARPNPSDDSPGRADGAE